MTLISPDCIQSYCQACRAWGIPSTEIRLGLLALINEKFEEAKFYFTIANQLLPNNTHSRTWLPHILSKSEVPDWILDIYYLFPEDSIYKSIHSFKKALDKRELTPTIENHLKEKIHKLSEARETYYRSSRFGFILEFFSKIRNFFVFGHFKSSAELGKLWTAGFTPKDTLKISIDLLMKSIAAPDETEIFYDCSEEIEDDVFFDCEPAEETAPETSSVQEPDPLPLSEPSPHPREAMLNTLENFWKSGTSEEKKTIAQIWSLIFKSATISNWNDLGDGKYSVDLENELRGRFDFSDSHIVILPKKIHFSLREEKGARVIDFTGNPLSIKSQGRLPDAYLNRIACSDQFQLNVSIWPFSKTLSRPKDFCTNLWDQHVTWETVL